MSRQTEIETNKHAQTKTDRQTDKQIEMKSNGSQIVTPLQQKKRRQYLKKSYFIKDNISDKEGIKTKTWNKTDQ